MDKPALRDPGPRTAVNSSARVLLAIGVLVVAVLVTTWGNNGADPAIGQPGTDDSRQEAQRVDEPHVVDDVRHARPPTTGEPPPRPATAGATVLATGTVIDRASRKPVPDVVVLTSDEWPIDAATARTSSRRRVTDADGRYELELTLRDAQAPVFAWHPDYVPARRTAWAQRVQPDGRIVGLDFELTRASNACLLTARLTTADSRPVSGAIARLERDAFHRIGRRPRRIPRTARSDTSGRLDFRGIEPGTYAITIEAPQLEDHRRVGVELQPRQRKDLGTIVLRRFAWAVLTGTVVSHDREPVAGITVTIGQPRQTSRTARTDTNGSYRLGRLAPGSWSTRFESDSHPHVLTKVELTPGGTTRRDVELPGGKHFLAGRALAGTAPAAGYEVTCEPEQLESGVSTSWKTETDSDGRFALRGLPRGPVDLYFVLRSPWTNHLVESVAVDRDDHVFRLPARYPPVRIHGVVRNADGVPIANATVSPQSPTLDAQRARTSGDGRYSIEVELTNDASFAIYAEHDDYLAARRVASYNRADARGRLQLDFVLERPGATGTVVGRVTDENARPIADVLCVIQTPGKSGVWSTYTDSRGHYRCEQVRSGALRVLFRHAAYGDHEAKLELPPGTRGEVDARLASRARFSRTLDVLDSSNAPVADAVVHAWKGPLVAWGKTDRHGRVTLAGLPAGQIVFSVEHAHYPRFETRADVRSERSEPIRVRLASGTGVVHGVVVGANGRPVPEVEVTLIGVERSGNRVHAIGYATRAGEFRFERLPDGDYTLHVWSGGRQWNRKVRPGVVGVRMTLDR